METRYTLEQIRRGASLFIHYFDNKGILSAITLIVFVLIVMISIRFSKKGAQKKYFLLTMISTASWVLAYFLYHQSTAIIIGLFAKLIYFSAGFIGTCFLLFVLSIINTNYKPSKKITLFLTIELLIIESITLFTDLFVKGADFLNPYIHKVNFGPLFLFYILHVFGLFATAFTALVRRIFKESNSKIKKLYAWVLIGFFITFLTASSTSLLAPYIGINEYNWIGPPSTIIFLFSSFWIMWRDRAFETKILLQRKLKSSLVVVSLVVLYTSLLLLITSGINYYYFFSDQRKILNELLTKNAIHIFTFIFLVMFSTLIAVKKPKNRQQKIFYSILVMISLWLALLTATEFATGSNESLLWWNRINYLPVLWFPMAMSYLFHNIIYMKNPKKYIFWTWLTLIVLMHYIFLSDLFILSVVRDSPFGFSVTPGPLQIIEAPYFMAPFIIYIVIAIKNWSRLDHHSKRQLKIILPGFTLASLSPVMADTLIIRMGYSYSLDQYTNLLAVLCFVITTTIAIFNHEFLEIKLKVTKQIVRRLFATILVLIILPAIIWFLFIKQYFPQNSTGKIVTILFIIFALFPLFNRLLENFINRTIFKNTKTPAEIINDIVAKIGSIVRVEKLAPTLLQELVIQLNLKGAAYLAHTNYHFELQEHVEFPEAKIISSLKLSDNTLRILVSDNSYQLEAFKSIINDTTFTRMLEAIGTEVVVPFKVEKKVVGLLLLKEKRHNEAFSKDELHILDTLSLHLATTIHNAFLFRKVKGFARELEEKVAAATKKLQEKNQKLARIEEEKSQFFANIAHEFKTPITILRGNIDIASQYLPYEQANSLQKEIQRMNQLTTDLLELSQAESGNLSLNIKKVDLIEIAKEVIEETEELAKEKNITFCIDLPQALQIEGDRNRLHQIMINLITNAIKYNKENGRIEIQMLETDTEVSLKVSDTGIGISERDLSKIFERFYRVDKVYSKKLGSTGLGLAIVKLMTELHGGTCEVQSKIGEGTTFIVSFPKIQKRLK